MQMVDVIYPNGQRDSWPATKDSVAFPVMLAGVENPQTARAYAADILGDLVWGQKGSVSYDLPMGPTVFTLETVEPEHPPQVTLVLNWHWLVLAAVMCALYIDWVLGVS